MQVWWNSSYVTYIARVFSFKKIIFHGGKERWGTQNCNIFKKGEWVLNVAENTYGEGRFLFYIPGFPVGPEMETLINDSDENI